KWVVIVSTMYGCPVGCQMCDAGGGYQGKVDAEGMLWQVREAVAQRFGGGGPRTDMLKVQFARMGDPALNDQVLEALTRLRQTYPETNVVASVSTVGPTAARGFLERLKAVKEEHYPGGAFQLQFSIHSTDTKVRSRLCPIRTLTFDEMAGIGRSFRSEGDKRVTLNFCLMEGIPIDPRVVRAHFDPEHFLIKLTPLNPTTRAEEAGLVSLIDKDREEAAKAYIEAFRAQGFDVLLSIGEYEENQIGSNCGQYLSRINGTRA
ncbi:MAG: radical SAM protein, partial [Thermoplasmata archaeon]|nr:radical SAM protein [Thermoplasmata archaeon]NIY06201.1 radical SAM protein [Thermoplasmata archaeon]